MKKLYSLTVEVIDTDMAELISKNVMAVSSSIEKRT